MLPEGELEQRLFLGRIGREAGRDDPVEEAVEDRPGVAQRGALRHAPQQLGQRPRLGHQPCFAAKSFMNWTRASQPARGNAL